jgi:arachidonate 15-lipoxygenase
LENTPQKSNYEWDFTAAGGIPVGKQPQALDNNRAGWALRVFQTVFTIRKNLEALKKKNYFGYQFRFPMPQKTKGEIVNTLIQVGTDPSGAGEKVSELFDYYNPNLGDDIGPKKGRVQVLEEYHTIFQKIPLPDLALNVRDDETFGYSFVGGQNPLKVEKLSDSNFLMEHGFDKQKLGELIGLRAGIEKNIDKAISNNRIYMLKYDNFNDPTLKNGVHFDRKTPKYQNSPIGLFVSIPGPSGLFPLAIKLDQKKSPLICYEDIQNRNAWNASKLVLIAAHSQYHEIIAHLAHTHLVLEAIVVCTRMQLPTEHPIYILLNSHFEGTMPINNLAVNKLIKPDNYVDRMVGTQYESTLKLVVDARLNFNFKDNYFPNRMRQHGVEDLNAFPQYPVRDFGMLHWNQISIWTYSYVANHYRDDFRVANDKNIQNWAKEMSSQNGGRLKGFGDENNQITSMRDLSDILTMIIFTAGPNHSMVNYAQKTDMAYMPAAPLSLYKPLPKNFDEIKSKRDVLDFLPPYDVALLQMQVMTFLGSVYHTRLGEYPEGIFKDPRDVAALEAFKKGLVKIETDMRRINERRVAYKGRAYEHLYSSLVPQSINI